MRKFGIDFLCDDTVAVHQVVRLVVEKTRIRPQKFREVMEAALESRRRDDFVHFRADTLHFRESNLVNLLRRQIRSGLPTHVKRIRGGAIRQRRRGNGFTARRDVSFRNVVMQFLNCRNNHAGVKLIRALRQSSFFASGKPRGKFTKRLQQRARQRIRGNQAGNLLGHIAQHEFRRRVPPLQSFAQQFDVLLDVFRQRFQPRQDILVVRHRLMRHRRQRRRHSLLNSPHLRHWHPQAMRHYTVERHGVVAILQPLFHGFQPLPVKVVVELLAGRKRIARNGLQLSEALVQMTDSRLDALSRIIAPPAILSRKPGGGRGFGIFLHPPFPIFVEILAEFSSCFCWAGTRLRKCQQRHHKQRAPCRKCQHQQCSNHGFPPAAPANSFSRSWASMTINRAVSSMPIAVLSTSTASAARTSGETLRSRSRLSRSITSSKTSGSVIRSPFSWCSFQRRSERTSGEASRKIFSSALGKTTVPMSWPSITIPPPAPARCCSATSTWRTFAIVASREAACATSLVLISRVTSAPSRKTQFFAPTASCSAVGARSSMCVWLASATSRASSSKGMPCRRAFSPSARYIAPLSKYKYPSIAATRRATLLFPEPAGPSMAMVSLDILAAQPILLCDSATRRHLQIEHRQECLCHS